MADSQDWIGKPTNVKLHSSFRSLLVAIIICIPGLIVVTVQRHSDLTFLGRTEVFVVDCDCTSVAHDLGFTGDPGLSRRVSFGRLLVGTASPRGITSCGITLQIILDLRILRETTERPYKYGLDPRFIQCDPVFDPVTEALETNTGVPLEIQLYLIHIQPPTISIMQSLRKIPMVQRHPGCDPPSEKPINQPVVECNPSFIEGVISPAKGNDPGPRDGEAVGLGAVSAQQFDVLLKAMVVVASDITVCAFCSCWLQVAVRVPDGFPAAIFCHGSFDLVRRRGKPPFKVGR